MREFSEPGPKLCTLMCLNLSYRLTSLLLAPSPEARLSLVATGFEPPVRSDAAITRSARVISGAAAMPRRGAAEAHGAHVRNAA